MKYAHFLIIILLSLSACSTDAWYKGMQSSEQIKCLDVPPSEYEDCMKHANDSYGEYQNKQKELDK